MTRTNEIKAFAKHYSITLAEAQSLWRKYSTKPKGYYEVLAVSADAKTKKGEKLGYSTGISYFAPGDSSGHQVCHWASKACLKMCLGYEGRARFTPGIQAARIRKTNRYFDNQALFIACLLHDCFRLMRSCARAGTTPAVRPNGTSDIPKLGAIVADTFPMLQAYDYTKAPRPWQRVKANYSLTFSRSGDNDAQCLEALAHGINVAVVFKKGAVPATFWGYEVIDGDNHDLRFLDKQGVIVGLSAKGVSAKKQSGTESFIILQ